MSRQPFSNLHPQNVRRTDLGGPIVLDSAKVGIVHRGGIQRSLCKLSLGGRV